MSKDAGIRDAGFGGTSETDRLYGILWSPKTIDYYSGSLEIIGVFTREGNKNVIYFNIFTLFAKSEKFKLVEYFLEFWILKHKIDDFFNRKVSHNFKRCFD